MWQRFQILKTPKIAADEVTNIQCHMSNTIVGLKWWANTNTNMNINTNTNTNISPSGGATVCKQQDIVEVKPGWEGGGGAGQGRLLEKYWYLINIWWILINNLNLWENHDYLSRTPLDLTWRSSPFFSRLELMNTKKPEVKDQDRP